jgi:hypothetical protein
MNSYSDVPYDLYGNGETRFPQRELVGGESAILHLDFWPVLTVVVLDFWCASATQSQVPTASPSPDPNLYGINPSQDGQTMVGLSTMLKSPEYKYQIRRNRTKMKRLKPTLSYVILS